MSVAQNNNISDPSLLSNWSQNFFGFCASPYFGSPPISYNLEDSITPNTANEQLVTVCLNALGNIFAAAFISLSTNTVAFIDVYLLNPPTSLFERLQRIIPSPNISFSGTPLSNTSEVTGTNFVSLSFSSDGAILAIGMPNSSNLTGQALIYHLIGSQYTLVTVIDNLTPGAQYLGAAVAVSLDGSKVAVSATNFTNSSFLGTVLVYKNIFTNNTNTWQLQQQLFQARLSPDEVQGFGRSLAFTSDASLLAVGAANSVIVYQIKNYNSPPITPITTLTVTENVGNYNQGSAVKFSTDGSTLIYTSNAGSNTSVKIPATAFVFIKNSDLGNVNIPSFTLEATLTCNNNPDRRVGIPTVTTFLDVSFDGKLFMFSDPNWTLDNSTTPDGTILVFQSTVFGWRQVKQILPINQNGKFGTSGSFDANIDKLMICAPSTATSTGEGEAFLYK